jgi:hypothetical protein
VLHLSRLFGACLLVATVVASSLGTPYGNANRARAPFTATVAGCGGPAQGAEMARGRVIGHVCAVVQASGSSGLVPRYWERVRVPPLALAMLHANRPLQIHWRPRRADLLVPVDSEAVVFVSTKLEIAGLRARLRHFTRLLPAHTGHAVSSSDSSTNFLRKRNHELQGPQR